MRRLGMYERERKVRKCAVCTLYVFAALFCTFIGSIHAWRAINAKKVNDIFPYSLSEKYCEFNDGVCYENMFD